MIFTGRAVESEAVKGSLESESVKLYRLRLQRPLNCFRLWLHSPSKKSFITEYSNFFFYVQSYICKKSYIIEFLFLLLFLLLYIYYFL